MKHPLLTLLLLLCSIVVCAHDFEVNGIYYNILSEEDKTVEVTFKGEDYISHNEYSGSVVIPSSFTYSGKSYRIISIGNNAFRSCNSLISIEIPSSVTSFGDNTFYNCITLASIVSHISTDNLFVPNGNAFYGVNKESCLLYVPVGATGTYNKTDQWKDFTNIVNGKCGDNLKWLFDETTGALTILGVGKMYNYALGHAPWNSIREEILSVVINDGVTSIGNYAFRGCSSLASIEIPSNVTSIGDNTFYNCISLTSIEISNSVTSIGNYAFRDCSSLASIEIPSSVISLGDGAFFNCTALTSIEIPESVTRIGHSVFENCTALTGVVIPRGVTKIDTDTFSGCFSLTGIVIPEDVTNIGENAFAGCSNLKSIVIPDGVTSIAYGAFRGCISLTSIVIPESVTSIGDVAFYYCTALVSIEISSSVTSIGDNAFSACSSLTSIVSHIPADKLFVPGSRAFYGVDKEACTLYVPVGAVETYSNTKQWKDFTYIANGKCGTNLYWVFDETTGALAICGVGKMYNYTLDSAPWNSIREEISSVVINDSVTSIGSNAFSGCTGLTSIVIPEGVTSIGDYAFYDCTSLKSVYSFIEAENLFAANAFISIDKEACILYVPAGAKETYATTYGWKDFTNIVEFKKSVNLVDGVPYTDTEPVKCPEVIYTRTFNNTNWQAWYVPFAIECSELSNDFDVAKINDVHQYDTNEDGVMDETTLEVVRMFNGTLKANYPYLVRAKEIGEKNIVVNDVTLEAAVSTSIDCSSVELKYYFVGTASGVSGAEMFDNGYYALSGGALMQATDNTVALKPFRWYMSVESRGSNVSLGIIKIRVKGETTDVDAVASEEQTEAPVYYDLSGRRVENPTRGIYIVNGKKVYVK